MAYSEKLRSLAVELYVEGNQSGPEVIEALRKEFPGLRKYPVEDTVRYWAELNSGRDPKAKTTNQERPAGYMTKEVLQRSVRRSYGSRYVEEAVAAYVRLLTAYLDRFYSRGFTAHQPLDGEESGTEFGVREQEFFHSLALADGDLDALEKELEQAHQSGNPEWAWRARERLVEHLRGYCRPKTITWNSELPTDLPESENLMASMNPSVDSAAHSA